MALRDRLEAETLRPGTRCTVTEFINTLTDSQRAEFLELASSQLASSVLARAVRNEYEYDMSAQSLARHRRGDCKCL